MEHERAAFDPLPGAHVVAWAYYAILDMGSLSDARSGQQNTPFDDGPGSYPAAVPYRDVSD